MVTVGVITAIKHPNHALARPDAYRIAESFPAAGKQPDAYERDKP